MDRRREARITHLNHALNTTDKLHLKQAATLLGVSEMTIRRDLHETSGQLILLGGYVVKNPQLSRAGHYLVSDQQHQHVAEKRILGALAAKLITAGDTIFFDCGTTVPFIINAIAEDLPFTAVCYSLNTFLALQHKPAAKAILCGGEFHTDNAIFTPLSSHCELDAICPDKAFISAAAVDLSVGATCFNVSEVSMKHRAMTLSQSAILVADHSKFGQRRTACIGELSRFSMLVTDSAPAEAYQRHAIEKGIKMLYPTQTN